MQTVRLPLNRPEKPGGVDYVQVTFNGHIEVVGRSVGQPRRMFLHELDDDERRMRIADLMERLE